MTICVAFAGAAVDASQYSAGLLRTSRQQKPKSKNGRVSFEPPPPPPPRWENWFPFKTITLKKQTPFFN